MKKLILCGLMILSLTGCATVKGTGVITVVDDGVEFTSSKPAKMTMKQGDTEYTYDSQSEGLISKIISMLTLGAVTRR